MISIVGYGCSTSLGDGVLALWNGLQKGVTDHFTSSPHMNYRIAPFVNQYKTKYPSIKHLLIDKLQYSLNEALFMANITDFSQMKIGIILASFKGRLEDYVWKKTINFLWDPITPLLDTLINQNNIQPLRTLCINQSNISSHAAFWVAEKWLESQSVSHVFIFSTEYAGEFLAHGLYSMNLLSSYEYLPFDQKRSGFIIGSAATAILLSNQQTSYEISKLQGASINSDSNSSNHASEKSSSLKQTIYNLPRLNKIPVDIILAGGHATSEDDSIESEVYDSFRKFQKNHLPQITSIHWCTGNTISCMGSLDVIIANELIRRQDVIRLHNTTEPDSLVSDLLIQKNTPQAKRPIKNILISTPGLGSSQGALMISQPEGAS